MTTVSASGTERSATREPTTVPSTIATNRRALDPAVRAHEPIGADELGQDAVLRGAVDRGAGADERVSHHRLDAGEHEPGAGGFQHVAEQQHMRLRAPVRERADPRREHDERDEERGLQRRHVPVAARRLDQHRDRGEQDRVVGERRQELRAEQHGDAAAHGTPRSPRGSAASTSASTAG